MINRLIGIVLAAGMLLANGVIVFRDVLPHWIANDLPPSDAQLLGKNERRVAQVGIYDDDRRTTIGHSWTVSDCSVFNIVTVKTTTLLNSMPLTAGVSTPSVLIETELTYRLNENTVDEFIFKTHGLPAPIRLEGAAMQTGEFACKWQIGPQRGTFLLDARTPAALGDVIRPFDRLPDLYVGQAWRVRLINPLSQILPNAAAGRRELELDTVIVRVTGEQTIIHHGREVDVFVVESGEQGTVAYVDRNGQVLQTLVDVPFLGRLSLIDEPYDETSLDQARRRFRARERYDTTGDAGST